MFGFPSHLDQAPNAAVAAVGGIPVDMRDAQGDAKDQDVESRLSFESG